jgi:hypothetical protein
MRMAGTLCDVAYFDCRQRKYIKKKGYSLFMYFDVRIEIKRL